jgi:hypothetical protein
MRAGLTPFVVMIVTVSAVTACGSSQDVTTGPASSGSATPAAPDVEDVAGASGPLVSEAAAEGVAALDCASGTASGMTTTETPPAPGEQREPAAVVAEALRAKQVMPEAAGAVESLGPRLRERWAVRSAGPTPAAPDASVPRSSGPTAGEVPPAEVATGLGAGGSVDVAAAVDIGEPGTPAVVVVSRDGRPVVLVAVSEQAPGYWSLEQLWACSEEVTVTEVPG